jgi:DNA-binding MarR family transcriptional regulator/cytochrome c2
VSRAHAAEQPVREAMDALRRIVRALRLSAVEVERQAGISVAQLFVLQQLAHDAPRSINELAAATATDPSTVSGVVRRLLDAGLVSRKVASEDARRAEVSLTSKGAGLLARAPAVPQAKILRALSALPLERRRALAMGRRKDAPVAPPDPAQFPQAKLDLGKNIFLLRCTECHNLGRTIETPLAKQQGPDLARVATRVDYEWARRWIADPHQVDPKTRMTVPGITPEQVEAVRMFVWKTSIDEQRRLGALALPGGNEQARR